MKNMNRRDAAQAGPEFRRGGGNFFRLNRRPLAAKARNRFGPGRRRRRRGQSSPGEVARVEGPGVCELHKNCFALQWRRHPAAASTSATSFAQPIREGAVPLLTVARTDVMRCHRSGPRSRCGPIRMSAIRAVVENGKRLPERSFSRKSIPHFQFRRSSDPYDADRDRPSRNPKKPAARRHVRSDYDLPSTTARRPE